MSLHQLEEPVAHPLFTVDEDSDDDEIKTVQSIHIARKENGKLMYAPRIRRADELTSLEQVHAEFGGGEYVLIGYNNGRISTRKTISLPGKSKPLFDEGVEPPPLPGQPTPVDPMAAMMGGQSGGLMGLIMMMMQQMMQQQAQAAASQTQMFIAMMQGNQQSSSEEKAQARAELQANIERERINSERTMSLMREMMQNRGGNGGGEDFTRGVEFMRIFAAQQIETMRTAAGSGEETNWMETIGQVLQGIEMFKGVAGAGGSLPNGVPEVAAAAAE